MKRSKRKVVVLSLLICLLALLSTMGSLAWFSDSDKVENEFMVATSDDDTPDEIFSVDVWEKTPEEDKEQEGYDYKDILPGSVYVKEPHVENTGYYDQYIRVTVTLSDATAWINALGVDYQIETLFNGFDASMWAVIEKKIEGETDTITYYLYLNEKLESGKDITLFNTVKIPESLTQEQAAAFKGSFTLEIKADAVQTENVGEDVYEAFQTVGM